MSRLIGTAIVAWVVAALAVLSPSSVVKGQVPMTGAGLGAPAGASCAPPSLSGWLSRWTASAGVTTSGGNVTAVTDQKGTANLSNSGTVPFTASGSYNSHPAFAFAAANNAALVATSYPFGSGAVNIAVYVVGIMTASTASFGGGLVYGSGAGSDFNTQGTGAFITQNGTAASIETAMQGMGAFINSGTISRGNHRFGVTADQTNNIIQYVDGSSSGTDATAPSGWLNNGTIVIGNRYSSGAVGTNAWDGNILEVDIFNAAQSAANITSLDNYVTCLYGT